MKKVILEFKIIPRSSNKYIKKEGDKSFKVGVHSPPEKGKANKELIEYISNLTGIAKSEIHIIKGEKNKKKLLEVPEECYRRIIEVLKT